MRGGREPAWIIQLDRRSRGDKTPARVRPSPPRESF